MARPTSDILGVAFEGEIVEILEEGGHRLAKIVLTAPVVVDLPAELTDAHLGDRVSVRGWIAGISAHKEDL